GCGRQSGRRSAPGTRGRACGPSRTACENSRWKHRCGPASYAISAPGGRVEIFGCLLGVGDASGGGVPLEALAGKTLRETPEQERFGDRTLHLEISKGGRSAFDCGEPLIDGGSAFAGLAAARRRRRVLRRLWIDAGLVT